MCRFADVTSGLELGWVRDSVQFRVRIRVRLMLGRWLGMVKLTNYSLITALPAGKYAGPHRTLLQLSLRLC